jgi:hypothetical protein
MLCNEPVLGSLPDNGFALSSSLRASHSPYPSSCAVGLRLALSHSGLQRILVAKTVIPSHKHLHKESKQDHE